jgi:hypothetical protein
LEQAANPNNNANDKRNAADFMGGLSESWTLLRKASMSSSSTRAWRAAWKAARATAPQTPGKRFFLRFFEVAGPLDPGQAANMSLVAFVTAAVVWRFASAAIRTRAVLATEFAPLSHMLMNGFFFNQGLDM